MQPDDYVNVRISTAVRPGWVIFTNRAFIVGMMTLKEWHEIGEPKEWDLMHISDHDKALANSIRAAARS